LLAAAANGNAARRALFPWQQQHGLALLHTTTPAASALPPHLEMGMPSLSPTMTQGNIAAWRKREGDSIAPGDVLAEVETDKATMEWEAQEEGWLAKIVMPAGSKDIPVGSVVAVVVEEEADVAAVRDGYSVGGGGAGGGGDAAEAAAPAAAASSAPPASSSSSSSFPPHEVLNMPALSPTMTAGSIVSWTKKVGDSVAPGDVLCEVETDKATMAWEAQEEGVVAAILLADGAREVPVGQPALVLVEDAGSVAQFSGYTAADAAGGGGAAAPAAAAAAPAAAAPAPKAAAAAAAAPKAAAAAPKRAPAAAASGARVVASPYARRLAAEAGVSLAGAAGSGPGGRIVADDVRQLIASGGGKAAATAGGAAAAAAPSSYSASRDDGGHELLEEQSWTDEAVNNIKRVTAARLLESKTTIPHYYLTMEVGMDALTALRAQANEGLVAEAVAAAAGGDKAAAAAAAKAAPKLSVNDFIVKAAALACKRVPEVNASWMGDHVRRFHRVDVNVAVMTPAGLMVPFVAGAEKKGVAAIGREVRSLAARAKAGALSPAEFMGGTFTVSNLGMYGIKQFAAIVNPPQAAILAVGAALPKVVRAAAGGGGGGGGGAGGEGAWREAHVMLATLSCDHRVVDGAVGAEWLRAFKHYVENPLTMLV
jgi:pyruvate dehydrogenase E2 component (dihydrolipoamide acetyltransferase)